MNIKNRPFVVFFGRNTANQLFLTRLGKREKGSMTFILNVSISLKFQA